MSDAAAPAPAPTANPAPAPAPAAATSALADLGVTDQAPADAAAAAPAEPTLKLPGKDAKPEDWAAFYRQIGAPESPEAYQIPVPEGADPAFSKTAATWFHEAGLRPEQAAALSQKYNEFAAAQAAEAEKAEAARIAALDVKNRAEQSELKTEWGQQFDANVELGKRAARQFMGQDAADILTALEDRVGYKRTMQIMAAIGRGLGEHDAAGLGGTSQPAQKSLAQRMFPNMPN